MDQFLPVEGLQFERVKVLIPSLSEYLPGFFASNQYKSPDVSFLGSTILKVNVPVPVPFTVRKERSRTNVVP